jgi:hypothetical protein
MTAKFEVSVMPDDAFTGKWMVRIFGATSQYIPLRNTTEDAARRSIQAIRYAFEFGMMAMRELVKEQINGLYTDVESDVRFRRRRD